MQGLHEDVVGKVVAKELAAGHQVAQRCDALAHGRALLHGKPAASTEVEVPQAQPLLQQSRLRALAAAG